jgi:hypothetical protein
MSKDLPDRVANLEKWSGLEVHYYFRRGVRYFVFGPPSRPIKTYHTYPKAKAFALGVAYGRKLG